MANRCVATSTRYLFNLTPQYPPNFANRECVIITITTFTFNEDLIALKLSKLIDKNILTVVNGLHFKLSPKAILEKYPFIDIVINSDYEIAVDYISKGANFKDIPNIIYRDKNNILIENSKQILNNLDDIPFPARHLYDNNLYKMPTNNKPFTTILTNRGCPYRCIFCIVSKLYGQKVYFRDYKKVFKEIEYTYKNFNISNFLFKSDTFTIDKIWVKNLCKLIIKSKLKINWIANSRCDTIDLETARLMKRAGCNMIALGAESGNELTFKKDKKEYHKISNNKFN